MAGFADTLSLLDAMDEADAPQAAPNTGGAGGSFADTLSMLDAMDQAEAGGGDFQAALAANGGNLYGAGMAGFYEAPQGGSPRMDPVRDPLGGQSIDVGAASRSIGEGLNGWGAAGVGTANMLTLGYGDELAGKAVGMFLGPDAGAQATEAVRGVFGGARESHPYATLAGEVAGGFLLPVGRLGQGASWLTKTLGGMATGAGYGAAYGSGSADDGDRVAGAGWGLGGGALGGALAVPLGAIGSKATGWIGNLVRQRRFFANGQLTPPGRSVLQQAGLNPDELEPAIQRQFAADAARAATPEDAAAVAPFREFGIPAYRHNITGTVDDAARFHGAARGGRGAAAEARVRPALETQQQATRDAAERIATDLGQGNPGDQWDAAAGISNRLRAEGQAMEGAAQAAYQAADRAGVLVPPHIAKGVVSRIQSRLADEEIDLLGSGVTRAATLMQRLQRRAQGQGQGVSLRLIDSARKDINRAMNGAEPEDMRALTIVKQEYDAWVDDIVDHELFNGRMTNDRGELLLPAPGREGVSPGAQGFEDLREARALWQEYARRFRGSDLGSRFIRRAIDADADPDMVVKWLFGAGRLGQSSQLNAPVARALRDTLGAGSEEWAMLRQAAFRQLTMKPEGTVQPGPAAVVRNINEFFNGPATRSLSGILFSAEERALMMRYASVLKRTVPPQGAVNHSGSGYEVSRVARDALRAVMTALTATTQGPVAGMAAQAAGRGVSAAADRMSAGAMLRPMPPRPAAPAPVAGVPIGQAGMDLYRERTGR